MGSPILWDPRPQTCSGTIPFLHFEIPLDFCLFPPTPSWVIPPSLAPLEVPPKILLAQGPLARGPLAQGPQGPPTSLLRSLRLGSDGESKFSHKLGLKCGISGLSPSLFWCGVAVPAIPQILGIWEQPNPSLGPAGGWAGGSASCRGVGVYFISFFAFYHKSQISALLWDPKSLECCPQPPAPSAAPKTPKLSPDVSVLAKSSPRG